MFHSHHWEMKLDFPEGKALDLEASSISAFDIGRVDEEQYVYCH